jgi:hypothetical protein
LTNVQVTLVELNIMLKYTIRSFGNFLCLLHCLFTTCLALNHTVENLPNKAVIPCLRTGLDDSIPLWESLWLSTEAIGTLRVSWIPSEEVLMAW